MGFLEFFHNWYNLFTQKELIFLKSNLIFFDNLESDRHHPRSQSNEEEKEKRTGWWVTAALMGYNFAGTRNNSEQLKWIDE